MKNLNLFLLFIACLFAGQTNAQRYLEQVFDEVQTQQVVYGENITVITFPTTGAASLQVLDMDLYTPVGDTETDRPLIIYFITGNFLPNPQNGATNGLRTDSTVVEMATRLAKMGYVVAVPEYRKGWNPISDDINVRISSLINAAYRGIQDARTVVRFFKRDVAENGNQFGICPERIAYMGQGTGGYIALGAATLDAFIDVVLPKFIDPNTGLPFVLEPVNGDIFGTSLGINPLNGDTLSLPNHVGFDSDVQLCVNFGGAMGDTSWLDESDPPMISFQVPEDPFAPYMEDILIVPTTGDLIVEVQGAFTFQAKVHDLANNQVFIDAGIDDAFTTVANERNNGYDGLFPLLRPPATHPITQETVFESAPWEWWDETFWGMVPHPSCQGTPPPACSFDFINKINNPDMSKAKAVAYIDTLIGYFAPRAFAALNLGGSCAPLAVKDILSESDVQLSVAPNPAVEEVQFRTAVNSPMESIRIYDLSGRLVNTHNNIDNNEFTLLRENLSNGLYVAKIQFAEGIISKKILFSN